MTRQLASIQRVFTVNPVPDSDHLDVVRVLGWDVVTKRNELKTNDLIVFIEIDAILPDRPDKVFEFMRKHRFRLRTVRLRGQISQGLVWNTSILPDGVFIEEGVDVTDVLGVTKFEAEEAPLTGRQTLGSFPSCLRKTDETRIQSAQAIIGELAEVPLYVSVKMDGQSLTFGKYTSHSTQELKQVVCTRNMSLADLPDNRHWAMARKLDIFANLPIGFAVQGEFCGPGVNGNRLGLKKDAFYAFQVWDIDKRQYLDYEDFVTFCYNLNIPIVPIISDIFVIHKHTSMEQLLSLAEGKYDNDHEREGIVIRPRIERYSHALKGRASVKVISNKYLLAIGE